MSAGNRFSFEFFPPRDGAQSRRFWRCFDALEPLGPSHVSVTWGASGTDSEASLELLRRLTSESDVPITAHLCCAGQSRDQLRSTLDTLEGFGIQRVLALRGDAKSDDAKGDSAKSGGAKDGQSTDVRAGDVGAKGHGAHGNAQSAGDGATVCRHASDLVTLIARERAHLEVSVAAYPDVHPEADSATVDLHWLKHKFDCGASRAVTQFFFDADVFLRLRDRIVGMGVDGSLVPGILPIHDINAVQRFASRCGTPVPASLIERFGQADDPASSRELAVEESVRLCQRLAQEGVRDFHLYTLNRADLSGAVVREMAGKSEAVAA